MMVVASNKKAFHEYEILETLEAGLVLTGDEVKSIRKRQVSINDAYATLHKGELALLNCNITPYSHAYIKNEDLARRSRKLLLHKRELNRLIGDISRKGVTIVPLKLYFNDRGFIKVELGIAKHKKKIDKKRDIKERDIQREVAREVKIRLR
jgi:SsrA-binding protein